MNSLKFEERVKETTEKVEKFLGSERFFAVIPGTGWKDGVNEVFYQEDEILYSDLNIPGSEMEVAGHKKSLKVGEINGRQSLVIGRVHPNEDITHPDLRQAMALIVNSLRNVLDGVLISNGVGTLHGPVGLEKGKIWSKIQTVILDIQGWAARGRFKEEIKVGDIAIVDDVKTSLVGVMTPLGAGQFEDFYHNGLHRDNNLYFQTVKNTVEEVQGYCSRAQSRFIAGPQFEGPADKLEFRSKGDDVIGMSGIQEILSCTEADVPFAQLVLATNGPFGVHTHENNQNTGRSNTEKAAEILRRLADRWPRR